MSSPHLDNEALARRLRISREAVELCRSSDVLDLHVDSFIPARLWGYSLLESHERHPLGGRFFGHLDFPRALAAGMSGAMWSITTNPLRTRAGRWRTLLANLSRLRAVVDKSAGRVRVVKSHGEYLEARAAGAHACLVAVQGGNSLSPDAGYARGVPDDVLTRVTLIHLTHSPYGRSSTPYPSRSSGLTSLGRELVASLDERRVFVDLAHAHPSTFWDAVQEHDASLPLVVTHTGASGVHPHWRNVDDRQLRAVADTGGVAGVIFQASFLAPRREGASVETVVDHIAHIMRVAGEDTAALGSDWDGAIVPPPDLRDGLTLPRVADAMLRRGFTVEQAKKVLGANFLRAFRQLRP